MFSSSQSPFRHTATPKFLDSYARNEFFIWNSDSPLPTPVSWSSPTYNVGLLSGAMRILFAKSTSDKVEDFYRGEYDSLTSPACFSTAHCIHQAASFLAEYVSQLTFTLRSMAEICYHLPDAAGNTLLTCKLGFVMALLKSESSSAMVG